MEHVLMATLGEAPIVVSGMVQVLRDSVGVPLDMLQVIYPDEPNERWIGIGYEMLVECLGEQVRVEPIPLPFDDAHSEPDSLAFLRLLNGYLQGHAAAGNRVYLSLAGGRKHTSALLAVLPQFYPCVQGLYHLHDTQASNPRRQLSIAQLDHLEESDRRRLLLPPASRFHLVSLPCESLTQATALLRWLKQRETQETPPPIPVSAAAESFWGSLLQSPTSEDIGTFDLWLSHTAYRQYSDLVAQGSTSVGILDSYLRDMTKAAWHQRPGRTHDHTADPHPQHLQEGSQTPLNHFTAKKNATAERVFYYTQPHAIIASNATVERLVVTRFAWHTTSGQYEMDLRDWVKNPDIIPRYRIADLPARPLVLIAPLGETPMVVTQAVTLLQSPQHHTPPVHVEAIYLVYPGDCPAADNGARLLQRVCERRGLAVYLQALPMDDLDTPETVRCFTEGLQQAIAAARSRHPAATLGMLLSGGRKGMSALAFYVAQHQGIGAVYHTTIIDPAREREIEQHTSYEAIQSLPTAQQAACLFPEDSSLGDFTLITVPLIAFTPA